MPPAIPAELTALLTPEWVRDHVDGESGFTGTSVDIEDFSGKGGLSCAMYLLRLTDAAGPREYIVKTVIGAEALEKSRGFGLAREGLFLKHFATATPGQDPANTPAANSAIASLAPYVPRCYYASGDMATGAKLLILERLTGYQCGHLIDYDTSNAVGGHPVLTPLHPPASVARIRQECGGVSELDMCRQAFEISANLHGHFWGDVATAESWKGMLRAVPWVLPELSGGDAATPPEPWVHSMEEARKGWEWAKENVISKAEPEMKLTQHFIDCIESSLGKIDYAEYRKIFADGWTVVHGDLYAGNMFYSTSGGSGVPIKLLDFEMVGLGSGPQELGQFMVSNPEPKARKANERHLVEVYHKALVGRLEAKGVVPPSAEAVWREYTAGGAARWVWFVCYLFPLCPVGIQQYFVDQLTAFLEDHFPNPSDLGMPRV